MGTAGFEPAIFGHPATSRGDTEFPHFSRTSSRVSVNPVEFIGGSGARCDTFPVSLAFSEATSFATSPIDIGLVVLSFCYVEEIPF